MGPHHTPMDGWMERERESVACVALVIQKKSRQVEGVEDSKQMDTHATHAPHAKGYLYSSKKG
jgi:hypothetical protein